MVFRGDGDGDASYFAPVVWSAQFHPESILSEHGATVILRQLSGSRVVNSYRLERQGLSGASGEIVSYPRGSAAVDDHRGMAKSENRTQTLFRLLSDMKRCGRIARAAPSPYLPAAAMSVTSAMNCAPIAARVVTHASPFPDAMLMRIEDKPCPPTANIGHP